MSTINMSFLAKGSKLQVLICTPDPEKGYNFPFLLIAPVETDKEKPVKVFVEGPNSVHYEQKGQQSAADQIAFHILSATDLIEHANTPYFNMAYIYNNLSEPIIVPLIERCDFDHEGEFYTQMLGKNVVHTTEGKFANLSDQVVCMTEAVKELYEKYGYKTTEKCGLLGASTSGVFAARMAFLEPESFDVCLSMSSNAIQPLPIPEYNGVSLPYPLGTADYEEITGKPFNLEEYKKIHQLFIVSEDEDNFKYDIMIGHPQLHDYDTQYIHSQIFYNVSMQDRQRMLAYIFTEQGIDNVECVVAKGGHNIDESKREIVLSWAKEVLNDPEKYIVRQPDQKEKYD